MEFSFISLSQGVLELQESHKVDNQTDMAIQYFLDRFYMSRISMRMLIHQHTLLFEPDADHNTNSTRSCGIKFSQAPGLCQANFHDMCSL